MTEKAKKNSELAKKRGARVKECRIAAGLTQEGLALKCNYGDKESTSGGQYICRIESGNRPLNSWDVARRLSDALNVDSRYLMCEVDYKSIDIAVDALEQDTANKRELIRKAFITILECKGYTIAPSSNTYDSLKTYYKDGEHLYSSIDFAGLARRLPIFDVTRPNDGEKKILFYMDLLRFEQLCTSMFDALLSPDIITLPDNNPPTQETHT